MGHLLKVGIFKMGEGFQVLKIRLLFNKKLQECLRKQLLVRKELVFLMLKPTHTKGRVAGTTYASWCSKGAHEAD